MKEANCQSIPMIGIDFSIIWRSLRRLTGVFQEISNFGSPNICVNGKETFVKNVFLCMLVNYVSILYVSKLC